MNKTKTDPQTESNIANFTLDSPSKSNTAITDANNLKTKEYLTRHDEKERLNQLEKIQGFNFNLDTVWNESQYQYIVDYFNRFKFYNRNKLDPHYIK